MIHPLLLRLASCLFIPSIADVGLERKGVDSFDLVSLMFDINDMILNSDSVCVEVFTTVVVLCDAV